MTAGQTLFEAFEDQLDECRMDAQRITDDEFDVWMPRRELLPIALHVGNRVSACEQEVRQNQDPSHSNPHTSIGRLDDRWFRQFQVRRFHAGKGTVLSHQFGQPHKVGVGFRRTTAVSNQHDTRCRFIVL